MAEAPFRVGLTATFLARLEAIEAFLTEADSAFACDRLLAELRSTVIPNLRRFPRIGRKYLDQPPQSVEALARLAALPAGAADRLREYLHGDCPILCSSTPPDRVVHLQSVRHRRELSFRFAQLWPAAPGSRER